LEVVMKKNTPTLKRFFSPQELKRTTAPPKAPLEAPPEAPAGDYRHEVFQSEEGGNISAHAHTKLLNYLRRGFKQRGLKPKSQKQKREGATGPIPRNQAINIGEPAAAAAAAAAAPAEPAHDVASSSLEPVACHPAGVAGVPEEFVPIYEMINKTLNRSFSATFTALEGTSEFVFRMETIEDGGVLFERDGAAPTTFLAGALQHTFTHFGWKILTMDPPDVVVEKVLGNLKGMSRDVPDHSKMCVESIVGLFLESDVSTEIERLRCVTRRADMNRERERVASEIAADIILKYETRGREAMGSLQEYQAERIPGRTDVYCIISPIRKRARLAA
jgi:hypothetical protein